VQRLAGPRPFLDWHSLDNLAATHPHAEVDKSSNHALARLQQKEEEGRGRSVNHGSIAKELPPWPTFNLLRSLLLED
jgi:hypothetical protein